MSSASPPMMTVHQDHHFRFMDLPAELRLMIYEFLPIQRTPFEIQIRSDGDAQTEKTTSITLLRHHVSSQILGVSRAVQNEARKEVARKVQEIRELTPRITMDRDVEPLKPTTDKLFTHIMRWLEVLRGKEHTRFCDWITEPEVATSSEFAGMPEPMLHFVEQAGIQMLSR
ncbi:hypothetical protein CC86DRAFT_431922 [Ophiobolus disseminans]|uniref:2EXR domain-containing protein n=1 Tax=Ophiobolus disseminans TaxID=1469910 RepID=A0A6A6ZF51_9PLEO|nr:hypothetical protein CC86DRAFT_431922 [Ophiobolus disseminans]